MKDIEKKILDEIEPLLETMGISIVELNAAVVNKNFTIRLVIFQEKGISLEECVSVNRVIKPRLELIFESRDPVIEITSPGIDRKIKSNREYKIFKGKAMRLLQEGGSEWVHGWIQDCTEDKLILKENEEIHEISLDTIRKAKLDYTMEAR